MISKFKNLLTSSIEIIFTPIYDLIFGTKKNVEHIWKPINYLHFSKTRWHLIEKPLQKRGIYLPLDARKLKNLDSFKTFNNEHKILDKYMRLIDTNSFNKTFIDIGASDGIDMSNTFNLVVNGFSGLMFEYNSSKFSKLATIYREFEEIELHKTKITPSNCNNMISHFKEGDEIDVLNLDIDSYDFYILKELLMARTFKFLILEVNPMFPIDIDFSVTFSKDFIWEENQFQGASVSVMYKLLKKHQYSVIHIDQNFLLALNDNYLNSDIRNLNTEEIDRRLTESLINNDYKRYKKYYKQIRDLDTISGINKTTKIFEKYTNYIIEPSGFERSK